MLVECQRLVSARRGDLDR
ncbi:putative extensin [Iris pallida]|uniref:Extensin n=1 Tax=Iris pallida TaxID=29817 RepID=A0AAX6DIC7_IRIPA|nr:putative extensin [Iris pallida]